jgi:hypothetical protein
MSSTTIPVDVPTNLLGQVYRLIDNNNSAPAAESFTIAEAALILNMPEEAVMRSIRNCDFPVDTTGRFPTISAETINDIRNNEIRKAGWRRIAIDFDKASVEARQQQVALDSYAAISNNLQPWPDTQDHSEEELARYNTAWEEFAVGMAELANDAGQLV